MFDLEWIIGCGKVELASGELDEYETARVEASIKIAKRMQAIEDQIEALKAKYAEEEERLMQVV